MYRAPRNEALLRDAMRCMRTCNPDAMMGQMYGWMEGYKVEKKNAHARFVPCKCNMQTQMLMMCAKKKRKEVAINVSSRLDLCRGDVGVMSLSGGQPRVMFVDVKYPRPVTVYAHIYIIISRVVLRSILLVPPPPPPGPKNLGCV